MQNKSVTVLFFASIRERLGVAHLQVPLPPGRETASIEAVIDGLSAARGAHWGEALRAANVIVAINQRVAERGDPLREGDELAFFPPVTGG
jgi:molybdopterin synthase sulfur carrier subunit